MSNAMIDELNEHMGIDGAARFDVGPGGITRVCLTAHGAEAHVLLHGAQVTHYRPEGRQPVLFMSDHARFAKDVPIRGGVPICFPWFGDRPDQPAHGFARTRPWRVRRTVLEEDGRVRVILALESSEATQAMWPHAFAADFMVTLGRRLKLSLAVRNRGDESFTFEEALHPYFAVQDVRQAAVSGLGGTEYLDKLEDGARRTEGESGPDLAEPLDRIYVGAGDRCVIDDRRLGRRIEVQKIGAADTVVWNPGPAGAKKIDDLGDEAWTGMLCVEPANVGEHAVTVEPGGFHEMQMVVSVEP